MIFLVYQVLKSVILACIDITHIFVCELGPVAIIPLECNIRYLTNIDGPPGRDGRRRAHFKDFVGLIEEQTKLKILWCFVVDFFQKQKCE